MKITTVRESLLAGGCAAAMALSGACQQEAIDPQAMADRAADNVAAVFQSAAHSAQGNEGVGKTTSRIGEGLGTVARSAGNVALDPTKGSAGALPRLISPGSALSRNFGMFRSVPGVRAVARPFATESMFGPSPLGGALYATQETSELASDLDETGAQLRRLLKERIFTAANLESKTDDEAIYRLRPDSTCRDLEDNTVDKKCADNLTKVELRVRLTRAGGGVRFELLVGSERARPLALSISDVQIALDVYLGDIKTTSAILARTLDSDDDAPAVLKGALRYALTKEGEHRASIAMAITEAVEVQEDADSTTRFKSAATNPLLALTFDGDAHTITGRIGLGQTEVFAPWQPDGNKNTGAEMHLVAGGLTGAITFTGASDTVKLTGLGLGQGPSYLEVRGQRILQLDVNENDGRAYDLSVDFDASGAPRLAIAPRFDLSMAWKLAAVMSDFKQAPPAHMLDERYRLKLDPAAGAGPVFGPFENQATEQGGLRLITGKLTLSSSKVTMPFTLDAGQCLTSQQPGPGQHPVLDAFKAGPCP